VDKGTPHAFKFLAVLGAALLVSTSVLAEEVCEPEFRVYENFLETIYNSNNDAEQATMPPRHAQTIVDNINPYLPSPINKWDVVIIFWKPGFPSSILTVWEDNCLLFSQEIDDRLLLQLMVPRHSPLKNPPASGGAPTPGRRFSI